MKITDFKIGTTFQTCTGQVWKCTDVGSRTILAIELNPKLDSVWLAGPPFVVPEVVFDERELSRAYRDKEEAIVQSIQEYEKGIHPGFPAEIVRQMGKGLLSEISRNYPYPKFLKIERVGKDGEILHPFGAELKNEKYHINVYRLFDQTFESIPEVEFIQYKVAKDKDFEKRKAEVGSRNKQR